MFDSFAGVTTAVPCPSGPQPLTARAAMITPETRNWWQTVRGNTVRDMYIDLRMQVNASAGQCTELAQSFANRSISIPHDAPRIGLVRWPFWNSGRAEPATGAEELRVEA
jgi:hypothetical protein